MFYQQLYRSMSNRELIEADSALDFRDPDLYDEIFTRAEQYEPGITEQYMKSFTSADLNSDEIFDRAVSLLMQNPDER